MFSCFGLLILLVLEFNVMISLEIYLLYLVNVTQSNLAAGCVTYMAFDRSEVPVWV